MNRIEENIDEYLKNIDFGSLKAELEGLDEKQALDLIKQKMCKVNCMDITEFINSKDIRNYHREINYKYSPLQAAWLIYQSARNTITEKHLAWKELIDSMPDCLMQDKGYLCEVMHLHDFLKRYMEVQNKCC